MSRKSRVWFPGAKYHITVRGVRRTNLFRCDEDREKYLWFLEEAKDRYSFNLHTFCLMTNHIHLQIEVKNTSPSIIMKYINTNYARYFNKQYHHSGHVFEKRYDAELIDSSKYELEVSKYIHLNPLKAGMVKALKDYRWSSYRAYILLEKSPLVYTNHILSYFPDPQSQNYDNYMNSGFIDLSFSDSGKLLLYKDE